MLQFVFFGRLVKEKGIDIIIKLIQKLIDEKENNQNNILSQIQFFVCGEGVYRDKIINLTKKTSNLHFFGRCNQSQLVQKIASANYTLMPSTFLETFGLSALESLSLGVPVIGFAKGGLERFVPPHLDISQQSGKNDVEKLYNLINFLVKHNSEGNILKNTESCFNISGNYFPQKRFDKFQSLSKNSVKKVVLISDYKTIYGGIETYLYKTKNILEQNGIKCDIIGANFGKSFLGKFMKKIRFLDGFLNIYAGLKINFYIKKNKPDLIWRNSCLRWLGRFPLRMQRNFNGKQRMMYHDLGYFCPFPSQIKTVNQIPKSLSVSSFCKNISWWKRPFVVCKLFLIKLLKKQLTKNIDLHLIPSSFIKDFLVNLYHTKEEKIKIFPHCLEEFFVGVSDGIKKNNKKN